MRSLASQEPHTLYVRMANLQMARTRQKRIRSALQAQVNDCTQRIREIDEKVEAIKAEIQKTESARPPNPPDDARPEDGGFEYEY
jgi:ppGpp synthetase/RelA/SpoT-type nucleotidyltranferase